MVGKTIGPNSYIRVQFLHPISGTFTFDLARVQLEPGPVKTEFEPRPPSIELTLCQRYYQKSFPQGTAPASNAGNAGAVALVQAGGALVAQSPGGVRFPVVMASAPSVVLYNPGASGSQIRNASASTNWSSTVVENAEDAGFCLYGTSPSGSVAGSRAFIHYAASAEL